MLTPELKKYTILKWNPLSKLASDKTNNAQDKMVISLEPIKLNVVNLYDLWL